MHFEQIPPPSHLADVVRCYWSVDSGGSADGPRTFHTMADGFPGAMVVLRGGTVLHDAKLGEMAQAFLYGQATRCRTMHAVGRLRAVGAYFQPYALRSVFGLQADEWTDACYDLLDTRPDAATRQAIQDADDANTCIAAMNAHITACALAHERLHDEPIAHMVRSMLGAHGDVDLQGLGAAAALSPRTVERRFRKSVGITPRLFARIRRFQHTLHQLRTKRYEKLSDIAFAGDYADQSHYIRSFREFTGIAPLAFERGAKEVIENFVEPPPA